MITKVLDETTVSITFTEAELTQLKSNTGIVVNVLADGIIIPLSQLYTAVNPTDFSQQVVLYCGALGEGMYFVFAPTTENPLVYTLSVADNPFGGSGGDNLTEDDVNNLIDNKITVTVVGDVIDLTIN